MKKSLFLIFLIVSQLSWAGDGSSENPFTVAEARALPKASTKYYVQGYIVGGRYDDFPAPWDNDFAISIADDASETDFNNCIQIKLESSTGHRTQWGLNSNSGNAGKEIKAHGFRDDYGGSSNYSFEGVDEIVEITSGPSPTAPTITLSTSTLSGFIYDFGAGPSSSQYFTINGSNLTNDVSVTPSTNYQISNDNINFQSIPLTYIQTAGNVSGTIYTRLKSGLAIGNYNEDIIVSSTGASSKNMTCDGNVNGVQYATLPYTENFNNCSTHKWTIQSITSNKDWNCGGGTMTINGYGGDAASEDYLISPSYNLDNYKHEVLSFVSYTKYADAIYPPVELLYSTDYIGYASTATWTPLVATWSAENSEVSTPSGGIDISTITGTNVCFAFRYTSTGTGAGTSALWTIDDFSIKQNPAGSTVLPNAWINEFHYDNSGTDIGEMIEVVIDRADTLNLADFTISLYKGSDGTVYSTSPLADFDTGDSNGDFTLYSITYPSNGLQNSVSGIALSWKGILVQFLSYEGSFIGSGGPADGIVSTDIGVTENGSEPAGQSLQLIGTGLKYSDFNWVDPIASPGSINLNQAFGTPASPPSVPIDWRYILAVFMIIGGTVIVRKLKL